MRIVFMGTPQISVPFLEVLIKTKEVVAVITQQDKPVGRGYKINFPPVKECALKYNIPVFQPKKIKTAEFYEEVGKLKPDLIVVVAYGKILPKEILNLPKYGCVNVHFSLLPKYRGASPMQWAVIKGEKRTGVVTMFMDEGLDTGDVILREEISIDYTDDLISLRDKLVSRGCILLKETVDLIAQGNPNRFPQDGESSYAPLLKKEDGKICWEKSSDEIYNLIRGTKGWPGAYIFAEEKEGDQKNLKIIEAQPVSLEEANYSSFVPGQIVEIMKNKGAVIKCGQGFLLITKVHPENKKVMECYQYLQGRRLMVGDWLGK